MTISNKNLRAWFLIFSLIHCDSQIFPLSDFFFLHIFLVYTPLLKKRKESVMLSRKVSKRLKRLQFCIRLRKSTTAKRGVDEKATACLVVSWELRCIMPGSEDFIYGCIRNKEKEIWQQYLGTELNSVRPFPGQRYITIKAKRSCMRLMRADLNPTQKVCRESKDSMDN